MVAASGYEGNLKPEIHQFTNKHALQDPTAKSSKNQSLQDPAAQSSKKQSNSGPYC